MAVVTLVVATLASASVAFAGFDDTDSVSHTISTDTLQPPTNPTTAHGPCVIGVSASVTVSWTATPSSWADGYEILGSTTAGGPHSTMGTASGAGTTSHTVNGLAFSTT